MSSSILAMILIVIALLFKQLITVALELELMVVNKTIDKDISDKCINMYTQIINLRSFAFVVASVVLWDSCLHSVAASQIFILCTCASLATFLFLFSAAYGYIISKDRPYIIGILQRKLKGLIND
jgi:hypothetical protein